MDGFALWLAILTCIVILESSLLVYFARWVMWRWNTVIQELLVAKNKEDDEKCG